MNTPTSPPEEYDLLVLGSGAAGKLISWTLARKGMKTAVIEIKSDRILGFTVFGFEAGEIMASVQVAMIAGLPYTALRDAIFTHPTMLEGLNSVFADVPARAVEMFTAEVSHA